MVRRIAVLGAECVGKTSLCERLAGSLPGLWVPEVLRQFCDEAGRTPRADEQPLILRRQVVAEAEAEARAAAAGLAWLLCDSAPLATALYSVTYFGDPGLLEEALAHHRRHYALTLLLAPDLGWSADGIQRDGPEVQQRFDRMLEEQLGRAGIDHHRIEGIEPTLRLTRAQAVIESLYLPQR